MKPTGAPSARRWPFQDELEQAVTFVLKKLDDNLIQFGGTAFPGIHTDNLRYPHRENNSWAHGFWTGMSWLAYELTGEPKYRSAAEAQLETYETRFELEWNGERVNDVHELGLVYIPSCVSAYKLTGNDKARSMALRAADMLSGRTLDSGMIYQHKYAKFYRTVIDTVMNLPLLHWAYSQTGIGKYKEVSRSHIASVLEWNVREDGFVYHSVQFNTNNQKFISRNTEAFSSSCWSRGLAWGVYGLALDYRYTRSSPSLEAALTMIDYYAKRLPQDSICCWDLHYTNERDQRDSSASAIMACALHELLPCLDGKPDERAAIERLLESTMRTLISRYTSEGKHGCDGILLHSVYNLPAWAGVDECCLWGDYFFFEALVRCSGPWNSYW